MSQDASLSIIKESLFTEAIVVHKILATLTPREEWVIRHLLGLPFAAGQKPDQLRHAEIAKKLNISHQKVSGIERSVWKKLQHSTNAKKLMAVLLKPNVELSEPLENIKRVTPDLMKHLKHEHDDITKIPPLIFEQIVAELLAGMGWNEVRLVGRNTDTSADILAGHFLPDGVTPIKIFIEVKRWKNVIGVEVFNQVLGAMISERERFGWHQAWIVAVGGAADTRKFSQEEWRAKGIEIKDKSALVNWLDNYKPNSDGLWLPDI